MANGKNKKMDTMSKLSEQAKLSNESYRLGYPDLVDRFIHAQNQPYRQKFKNKGGGESYSWATTDKHFLEWVETEYLHGIKDNVNRMPYLNKYHQSDAGKSIYSDIQKVHDSGKRLTSDEDFMNSIKGRAWNELPNYNPDDLRERRRYDPSFGEEEFILESLKKPDVGIY